jgi:drug/metabolite transporter (DMT)-like permease
VLAVFFALLSAATFGLTNATARRGVVTGTVTQVVGVSMPIGLVLFALAAAGAGQIHHVAAFTDRELFLLACAGVIHFLLGRYCGYRSMQAMGANLAGPVQQWSLLVTVSLAIAFLGETLDLLKLAGIAMLVLGPVIVVQSQRAAGSPTTAPRKETFKPKLAEGYFFGILSCLFWGSSPVFVRAVVGGTDRALAGGVVSYSAATAAVALIMLLPSARRDIAAINRENLIWAAWAGVLVCVSQMFHYLAMALAPLTVVQPLMQFQVVFRTLFGWVINREHEVFSSGVIAAIVVSLIGAIFLSIDARAAIEWMNAPGWLRAALAWSWPAR